jgi:predicted ATP-grasp superfamily ATP-dependent carboligase
VRRSDADTSGARARPHAVLVGLDTLQGLQAARVLAGHDIPLVGVATDRGHFACRTRVCRDIVYADTTGDGLTGTLLAIAGRLPQKAVLYPCHDHAVAVISRDRDAIAEHYHVMLPDANTVAMLMQKDSLYEFARRHGFRVPASVVIREPGDIERASSELRFPCILKPSCRSPLWNARTRSKAYLAESAAELLRLHDAVRGWAAVLVVQEWVPGGDGQLYSFNGYFDRQGRLAAGFVARKLRQWPPRMGSACLSEEARNDAVRDEALRLLGLAGFRGLGYVEMKHDARSGEHWLIEANVGRPTGRCTIAEAGGVEILYCMYCDALGLPLPAQREQSYRGIKWLDLRHDLQSALWYWRQGELTAGDWQRTMRGAKTHAVLSWTDPLPFLWDLWRAARGAFAARAGLP